MASQQGASSRRRSNPTTSNPATPRKGGIIPLDYDLEGSDVGYRWFTREGHQPLFPFGFGLSYTTFELAGLRVSPGAGLLCLGVGVVLLGRGRLGG